MNIALFIARRIRKQQGSHFSKVITHIAVWSIALGVATLIISFAIFEGFQQTILDKIVSHTGHIQILKFDMNNSYETSPISTNRNYYQKLKEANFVERLQSFTQKPVLLRTDEDLMGLILKGVGNDYDTVRFKNSLIEGRFIHFEDSTYSKEIIISEGVRRKLDLKLGDEVLAFFLQDPPRQRKLEIVGIYQTGIEDFDDRFVYADQAMLQRLNNWADTLVGGYEIFIKDFSQLEEKYDELETNSDYDMYLQKVTLMYGHFFEWFAMIEKNVLIFLVIILFVALFNVASVLLILITERISMIGMLKALGASNLTIEMIFFYNGLNMLWKGLVLGNLIGLTFCGLQSYFEFIPLDPETYYMSTVPIAWNIKGLLLVNILNVVVVLGIIVLPYLFIKSIKPIRAIRFD